MDWAYHSTQVLSMESMMSADPKMAITLPRTSIALENRPSLKVTFSSSTIDFEGLC